jgi:hypothetical protein
MSLDSDMAGRGDAGPRLSLEDTLIRSDLPKSVHRCNVRNLDGHLRLEKQDR